MLRIILRDGKEVLQYNSHKEGDTDARWVDVPRAELAIDLILSEEKVEGLAQAIKSAYRRGGYQTFEDMAKAALQFLRKEAR